jgi:hypothetical protein
MIMTRDNRELPYIKCPYCQRSSQVKELWYVTSLAGYCAWCGDYIEEHLALEGIYYKSDMDRDSSIPVLSWEEDGGRHMNNYDND